MTAENKKKLNDEQKAAVRYDGKRLLISAGPGAGKTFVLIERIKYLLNKKHVNPESILVITFTRKAANQLRERLSKDDQLDESTVNKMFINTIHSFCINFISENGCSDINLLESENNNERKLMFLRKHKKDLGFTREAHMGGKSLHAVVDKFDEYTTFNVNTDKLVEYIKENKPVAQEYKDLIAECGEGDDFEYPYDEVEERNLKDSQYNARHLAIAKAYPKYIELLEQEASYDFNYLQVKTRNILRNNPKIALNSRFKNILIDEYQDIDPIQNDIFSILSKDCDSFTVVGDDDQSIYAFRGSIPKYFTDFADNIIKKNNPGQSSVKYLSTNFRSCPEVVEYNEELIASERVIKKNLKANREDKGGVYYLLNDTFEQQADKISEIILHLYNTNKIKQYSDVAVLLSSVKYGKGKDELLKSFDEKNIPYSLSENNSLMSNPEVQAMIILLWYMKEDTDKVILSNWEKEWLNLSAFSLVEDILNLDSKTCQILTDIEEEYRENILKTEKEVYKELTGKSSRIGKFAGIFKNRDDKIVQEVFSRVERFDLSKKTRSELEALGITDKHDLDLFENLRHTKEKLYDTKTKFYQRPSILDVYYDILQYSGILENRLDNPSDENERILRNLGQITDTIANYEDIVTKYSVNGLLWYIFQEFDEYATTTISSDTINKVQIMTVHKSKGLEFPVVILGSIMEGKFPKHRDTCIEAHKTYINGNATYYTPIDCLEYKKKAYDNKEVITEEDIVYEENKEAIRVFYVATTRAEDILILSSITDGEDNVPEILEPTVDSDKYEQLADDYDILAKTKSKIKEEEKDRLKLSYTHISEYNNCGQEYNLRYNYHFKNTKNKALTFGQVAHTILNLIHQKQIAYQNDGLNRLTSNDEIKEIIERVKEFNQNIENNENDEFKEIEKSIYNYWNENKDKYYIVGSEVPFSITYNDYDLEGKIDLIIKDKNTDDITIIDFKTTNETNAQKLIDRYQQQLFTYAMAVKKLPEYKNYNIKDVMIYSVKYSQKIPISLDDVDLDEVEKSINNTVKKILDGDYSKCVNDNKCFNCEYNKSICRRK